MPDGLGVRVLVLLLLLVLFRLPVARRESFPPELPRTRLIFGGDVMLARFVGALAHRQKDPAWPFRELAPVLSQADLAFVNLESPFSDRPPIAQGNIIFKAEPAMVEGLKLAGIDIVSTANNHARDCGDHGLEFTLEWLGQHSIGVVGTGPSAAAAHEGAVLERHGVRFGFLAYTWDQSNGNYRTADERVAMLELPRMQEDVARLRQRADVVIVSMHAGEEYQPKPNAQQVEFARAAIEAGAKLVIGHHPHVVQPFERYRDGVIFYSLGNLVFDQFQRKETQEGLLAEVTFVGKRLERWETRRVEIRRTAPVIAHPGKQTEPAFPER